MSRYGEWQKDETKRCGCDAPDAYARMVESYDGAHDDWEYQCRSCKKSWWVDGCDS